MFSITKRLDVIFQEAELYVVILDQYVVVKEESIQEVCLEVEFIYKDIQAPIELSECAIAFKEILVQEKNFNSSIGYKEGAIYTKLNENELYFVEQTAEVIDLTGEQPSEPPAITGTPIGLLLLITKEAAA